MPTILVQCVWGRSPQEDEANCSYCMYSNVNGGLSEWTNVATKVGDYNKTECVPRPKPQAVTEHDAIG